MAVRSTDVIDALHGLLGCLEDAVEELHLVHHPVGPALLGGAVVGEHHEDGVVESAETSEAVHEPTDLGVGVVEECGERLLESGRESALDLGEIIPGLDTGITGREPRVRGHDAHLDLPREPSVAYRVPAVVEAPPVLLHELAGGLMRGVGRAEGQVEEHRSIGADADRVGVHRQRSIDQVLREVVAVLGCRWGSDHVVVGDQVGMELVGLAVEESVEAVEAATEGPLVEGPGRRALFDRSQMPFAGAERRVAPLAENLGHRRRVGRDVPELVREAGPEVRHRAHTDRVVGPARHQRCPSR